MKSVSLHYNEAKPSDKTKHLVYSYFEFVIESDSPEPIPHEVFPDGCLSLIYRRNQTLSIEMFLINGLTLETFHTEMFADDILWGVKFSPAAGSKILRCDPAIIRTTPLIGEEFLSHLTIGLLDKLKICRNFEEAADIYENALQNLEILRTDVDEKIYRAVEIIEAKRGEVKVVEIAKAVNLSSRQLERRFRQNTGLTPKQFIRIRRIRSTVIHLVEQPQMNWANRAAEIGFTDQAHLAHEFSTLTGRTPNAFAKRIKKINHGDLVK